MNMYAKTVVCSVLLMSCAAWAGPFPTSSRANGMMMYATGQVVPARYLVDSNVIQNYHHYHLDKPVEGYEWVRGESNEYLLVSVKSHILRRIEERPDMGPETTAGR